ncbi:MAG: hypothetical protein R3B44_05550 [Candidatus Brocadiaceae bacterium]
MCNNTMEMILLAVILIGTGALLCFILEKFRNLRARWSGAKE